MGKVNPLLYPISLLILITLGMDYYKQHNFLIF
ncbi:uncharacterized protein METZ01_LOCUS332835 [marine metagenome]|uniref:Uncharacterized protein n=1 Tax=marine metagenome TaxID=408172 RepID=A0A382Q6W6_9ZZZZ